MDRGLCTFVEKALHAQQAGAAAVIVANTDNELLSMAGDDGQTGVQIPVVAVAQTAGQQMQAALQTASTADAVTLVLQPVGPGDKPHHVTKPGSGSATDSSGTVYTSEILIPQSSRDWILEAVQTADADAGYMLSKVWTQYLQLARTP